MAFENKPSFRLYCRAAPNYNLSVSDGVAILAPAPNHKNDDSQHWYKDEKPMGPSPCFSLVNKATGQALKHTVLFVPVAPAATGQAPKPTVHPPVPVRLFNYNPDVFDASVLWTIGDDCGDGYRAITSFERSMHLEAAPLNDLSHHRAIIIINGTQHDGNNQKWIIEQYS